MVADAEGEVFKSRAIVSDDELEDHAEAACGRREVDLEALGKLGAVAVFRVAFPQLRAGDAAGFVPVPCRFGGIAASRCRSRHVFAEGVGIKTSSEPQLAGQRLPLAVGRKHVRAMLRHEALPLLFGCLAGA
jgi:hypothetical protein